MGQAEEISAEETSAEETQDVIDNKPGKNVPARAKEKEKFL